MIVQLFAQKLLLLSTENNYKDALNWSKEHYLYYVPILNNNHLLGYLNIHDLRNLDFHENTPIEDILRYENAPLFVYPDEHVYDALLKLQFQDTLVILNNLGEYVGLISIHQIPDILKHLQLENFVGSTLVLSVGYNDYCLSEISKIAESCNAKIISLFLSQHPTENCWYVNIKFNTEDLSSIVSAYERFGYEVAYLNPKQLMLSDTKNNFESLMKFLEI